MNIFNYFIELAKQFHLPNEIFCNYNIINIGGKFVYVEGHKGIITLKNDLITFKIGRGFVEIKGQNLILKELANQTLTIQGIISKIEVF